MASMTESYLKRLTDYENSAPGAYQSRYQGKIDELMNTISSRKPFSYDFNADPLYHQYKDQYVKLGNEAAMNAAADVAALTGGYGNSYAATAASQANQQYLTRLNDIIPELYRAAQERYAAEGEDLYNQYGMYSDAESADYGKYRDTISDYMANRDYYYNAYRGAVGDDQWQAEYNARYGALAGGGGGSAAYYGGGSSGSGSSGNSTSSKEKAQNTTNSKNVAPDTGTKEKGQITTSSKNVAPAYPLSYGPTIESAARAAAAMSSGSSGSTSSSSTPSATSGLATLLGTILTGPIAGAAQNIIKKK